MHILSNVVFTFPLRAISTLLRRNATLNKRNGAPKEGPNRSFDITFISREAEMHVFTQRIYPYYVRASQDLFAHAFMSYN